MPGVYGRILVKIVGLLALLVAGVGVGNQVTDIHHSRATHAHRR